MTPAGSPLPALRHALDALAAMRLPPEAARLLADARAALHRAEEAAELSPEMPPQMHPVDPAVFQELLDMAGADVAPDLLVQMLADLRATDRALTAALATDDLIGMRGQCHILTAVAGAAGAAALQADAADLGEAARLSDRTRATTLGPRVLNGLRALIAFVDSHSTKGQP